MAVFSQERVMGMKAWLVINGFLQSSKFQEINQWLLDAAKKRNIDMEMKTNKELLFSIGNSEKENIGNGIDFVLFWDKDIRLAKSLEKRGLRLFNSSAAIELCDDKSLTHLALEDENIPVPTTIIAPMTYTGVGYTDLDFVRYVEEQLGFPMIIKECFGSFGQQVYLVKNQKELFSKVVELAGRPFLFQQYIKSSFARDIRIQVVGNQVVAAMYRYSDTGDFRANISNGGKMENYEPSKEQKELALTVCKKLGLDFAGVDILFDEEEKPILCEVNSNAHFKNIYDCTGVNVADYIIEYLLGKLNNGGD